MLNVWPKWKPAKNVILFIGDGMGISTTTATRFFIAQQHGQRVEDVHLSWDTFPAAGLIKVGWMYSWLLGIYELLENSQEATEVALCGIQR